MTALDQQITAMEQRVLNAPSPEASAAFHARLDELRERRDRRGEEAEGKAVAAAYRRGYQAGHQAARMAARRRAEPPCNHEGMGYPWCPTCRPRTIAALKEMGIDYPEPTA